MINYFFTMTVPAHFYSPFIDYFYDK
jgi:hypothetical protein